jgi:hypothetical protein
MFRFAGAYETVSLFIEGYIQFRCLFIYLFIYITVQITYYLLFIYLYGNTNYSGN